MSGLFATISLSVCTPLFSSLGGAVVTMPATGPKGRRFEPGQGDGFLRPINIRSTPSFGWEVKILRHVKDSLTYQMYWIRKIIIPSSIPSTRTRCLCWYDYQRALVDKSGVTPAGIIIIITTALHSFIRGIKYRPVMAAVLRRQSHPTQSINQSINQLHGAGCFLRAKSRYR
jgi:hypothetical protein